MSGRCLLKVCAHDDVPAEALGRAHKAMRLLPEHVVTQLWGARAGVFLRADFPWDNDNRFGAPWAECGGYWDSGTRYAVINASWCTRQSLMTAVVTHELGHALSIDVLAKPHRDAAFRDAWSRGRAEIASRWHDDYRQRRNMGVYCLHWTQGVAEVWADAFCWLLGAKRTIHPAFGRVFSECIELVSPHVHPTTRTAA